MRRQQVLTAVALAAGLGMGAQAANAAFKMELNASSTGPSLDVAITDNGSGDANAASQVIQYSGAIGTFDITISIGVSNSPGSITSPATLQVTSIVIDNNGDATGNLAIRLTDTGFTVPAGGLLASSVGGTFFGNNAGSSVTFTSYVDDADTEFGTPVGTTPQTFNFSSTPLSAFNSTTSTAAVVSGSYSLTNTLLISVAPFGQVNLSGTTGVVPEPATLGLLAGLGLVALRRR